MPFTDFLFEGSPPPAVTKYGETTEQVPEWYSSYMQGLLARSNAIAGEAYQGYSGPRVSALTADQNKAFDATRDAQGTWKPDFNNAEGALSAGLEDSAAVAAPGIARAGALSAADSADPYMAGASKTFTGSNVNDYMNPYNTQVTDRIAELGNRNLMEKILPGVQDQFIAAGQVGSTRNAEFTNRAIRDTAGEIAGAQGAALAKGYETSGSLFGADANRQGALASTEGSLVDKDRSALLAGSELEGKLTGETGARRIDAGKALMDAGTGRQSSALKDAAALESIGSTQQQQGQRNLDTAYDEFTQERDAPKNNAEFINAQLRGLTVPKSTSSTSTGPLSDKMGASPLAQIAGAGTGLAAYKDLFGFKKGGRVRYAEGGPASASGVRKARGGRVSPLEACA